MSRSYSREFKDGLSSTMSVRTGVLLGRECVRANLPAKFVAKALKVSRMTVYCWFRGAVIRGKNEELALAFMSLVREDLANAILPAKSVREARAYIEAMIGESLEEKEKT